MQCKEKVLRLIKCVKSGLCNLLVEISPQTMLHSQVDHMRLITSNWNINWEQWMSDILECEVKWALGSITTNKASGGDRTPVELFQILKYAAIKVLHSICQQLWKTLQWPQDWKSPVFIPIPKKGNAKKCSNCRTIALISHANKVMLNILKARLQKNVNRELPDVEGGFRKGRGTRDQIANIHWIIEKARVPGKYLLMLYWLCQSLWLYESQQTVGNS